MRSLMVTVTALSVLAAISPDARANNRRKSVRRADSALKSRPARSAAVTPAIRAGAEVRDALTRDTVIPRRMGSDAAGHILSLARTTVANLAGARKPAASSVRYFPTTRSAQSGDRSVGSVEVRTGQGDRLRVSFFGASAAIERTLRVNGRTEFYKLTIDASGKTHYFHNTAITQNGLTDVSGGDAIPTRQNLPQRRFPASATPRELRPLVEHETLGPMFGAKL